MPNVLSPLMKQQFIGPTGAPIAFGLLYSYEAGTTTPLATYDASGATNPNPITLDAAGRADVWVPPNVAYKFNLTDSAGNQIPGWPIDNVVNSQLITLYGGVDTGGVNSYIINFTANFSTLTNGILIYWVPSHTNSGGSTINVNGLGPISIIHPDLSALQADDLVASTPAAIMYLNGVWVLLNGAWVANLYVKGIFEGWGITASAWVDASVDYGFFVPTWNACFSNPQPTGALNWVKVGNLVLIYTAGSTALTAVSSSTTLGFTNLPAEIQPLNTTSARCSGLVDNGNHGLAGTFSLNGGGSVGIAISLVSGSYVKDNLNGFTSSGTKGLNGFSCIYPLH